MSDSNSSLLPTRNLSSSSSMNGSDTPNGDTTNGHATTTSAVPLIKTYGTADSDDTTTTSSQVRHLTSHASSSTNNPPLDMSELTPLATPAHTTNSTTTAKKKDTAPDDPAPTVTIVIPNLSSSSSTTSPTSSSTAAASASIATPSTQETAPSFHRANTVDRRTAQLVAQNEAAWRKHQQRRQKSVAIGEINEDDEEDGIAAYFPHISTAATTGAASPSRPSPNGNASAGRSATVTTPIHSSAGNIQQTGYTTPSSAMDPSASRPFAASAAITSSASVSSHNNNSGDRHLKPSLMQMKSTLLTDSDDDPSATPTATMSTPFLNIPPTTRNRAASQGFLSPAEQAAMVQLPPEFGGAKTLIMPQYLQGQISNVTLPSRLDLLGRRGFKLAGALYPRRIGNAVLGWAPVWISSWKKKEWRIQMQLFMMPVVFSKSMAKILLYLRLVVLALFVIFVLDQSGAVSVAPGRVWAIGVALALFVMYKQSTYRKAPDGVMAFCRSMGVPEVEEYMFSYAWKVEAENVRTLAKAVWKAGAGVWIDVVKLCPGDEIRPMVRTTVKRVHRVVIFLCDEYCQSVNCCVEMMEAVQHPEKCTVCIIKDNIHPNIMRFLIDLKSQGLRICVGFDELMETLDLDIQDMSDIAAFQWWRSQSISGAGVPSNIVPSSNWPMSRFSFNGRIFLPEKSVDVGTVYISGDCKTSGTNLALPWLLFVAIAGVAVNVYDMYDKYTHSASLHTVIDYIFLGVIASCNCAPFIGFNYLIDRRRDCHVCLRPLLASRSMGKDGIKVRVIGDPDDPIYIALRQFLTLIGHLAHDLQLDAQGHAITPDGRREPRCVTVYIMENMQRRDAMFGSSSSSSSSAHDPKPKLDTRYSLFIWSGWREKPGVIPFTDDEIGQRLMRYLVLVVDWEKHGLSESLFSAIGVRVVDILHEKPSSNHHHRSDSMHVSRTGTITGAILPSPHSPYLHGVQHQFPGSTPLVVVNTPLFGATMTPDQQVNGTYVVEEEEHDQAADEIHDKEYETSEGTRVRKNLTQILDTTHESHQISSVTDTTMTANQAELQA